MSLNVFIYCEGIPVPYLNWYWSFFLSARAGAGICEEAEPELELELHKNGPALLHWIHNNYNMDYWRILHVSNEAQV
jgi:hypothetical protein